MPVFAKTAGIDRKNGFWQNLLRDTMTPFLQASDGRRAPARRAWSFVLLAASVAVFAVLSTFPLEGAFRTPDGALVQGWLSAPACRFFPLIAAALAGFSALVWRGTGVLLRGIAPGAATAAAALQALRPAAFLPAIAAVRHMSAWIGTTAAALALPFGSAVVAALCAERLSRPFFKSPAAGGSRGLRRLPGSGSVFAVFAAFFTFYLAIHLWQDGDRRFAGGGDAVHYGIQLKNLVERGNLDLTDRVEREMDAAMVPAGARDAYVRHSHMRRNGAGRIYSVHGFGWPLLAWPFAKAAGDAGVVLFMLLSGAACVAGAFAASVRAGASRAASLLASGFLGASWWWSYVALNRLPEMLGCALCAWGFWAVLAQRDPARRSLATAVSFVCTAWLPVAHMRFYPIAVVLAAAFWASGIASCGTPARNAARLALHATGAAGAWIALWIFHESMFAGSPAFRMSDIFFSHPVAMLGVFADRRGVGTVLPLAWLLATAPLAFVSRKNAAPTRQAAGLALALEATTLVACNANQGALVGSCVTARYFLQAIPPLVPVGALWLDRAGRPGRAWWFALAFPPVFYLFAVSPFCSRNGLVHSPYGMWDLDAFRNFWHPWLHVFDPAGSGRAAVGLVLPAAMAAAPWFVRSRGASKSSLAAFAVTLAAGLAAGTVVDSFSEKPVREGAWWALGNANHWHFFRRASGPPATSFFETFADDPWNRAARSGSRRTVLSSDAETPHPGAGFVLNSRLARNDWAGRPLRWAGLARLKNRSNRHGAVALRVSGRVAGCGAWIGSTVDGVPDFPLGIHVDEGRFDVVLLVRAKPAGTFRRVFGALDSKRGTLFVDTVECAPWAPGLERAAGPFPAGAEVADGASRRKRQGETEK